MFKNIIDKDFIMIDQDDNNSNLIRLSWFKDNHFQGELYIDLEDDKYDNPFLRNRQDWYFAKGGNNIEIYFSYNNKLLSIDYSFYGDYFTSHTYRLEDLFKYSTP